MADVSFSATVNVKINEVMLSLFGGILGSDLVPALTPSSELESAVLYGFEGPMLIVNRTLFDLSEGEKLTIWHLLQNVDCYERWDSAGNRWRIDWNHDEKTVKVQRA